MDYDELSRRTLSFSFRSYLVGEKYCYFCTRSGDPLPTDLLPYWIGDKKHHAYNKAVTKCKNCKECSLELTERMLNDSR